MQFRLMQGPFPFLMPASILPGRTSSIISTSGIFSTSPNTTRSNCRTGNRRTFMIPHKDMRGNGTPTPHGPRTVISGSIARICSTTRNSLSPLFLVNHVASAINAARAAISYKQLPRRRSRRSEHQGRYHGYSAGSERCCADAQPELLTPFLEYAQHQACH
jgi:hypothetical protein